MVTSPCTASRIVVAPSRGALMRITKGRSGWSCSGTSRQGLRNSVERPSARAASRNASISSGVEKHL